MHLLYSRSLIRPIHRAKLSLEHAEKIMTTAENKAYYPPPESQGGWRWLDTPQDVLQKTAIDAAKLDQIFELQSFLFGSEFYGIAIIRHGHLVREHYNFMGSITGRYDIWSCTKSFSGIAWGMLIDDSREGRLPEGRAVDLDTAAYTMITQGYPLSDPRKEAITMAQLLSMTSGIPGEAEGHYGVPTATGSGPFEYALGQCSNRYGKWVDKLVADPGCHWDYSDPAMTHLSLAFAYAAGQEIHEFMAERVFAPIGIEQASWDMLGGSGCIGPHTNPHVGLHISARELARFGYLLLNKGVWDGKQLIPRWWVELSTQSSQKLNPDYGYSFWVNSAGSHWPGLPTDMFALEGSKTNRCYVIPSLDLVVVRVGTGPSRWNETDFISAVVGAIGEGDKP